MLKDVKINKIGKNEKPNFIKTQAVEYEREDKKAIWEMILSHDSVHVLVNNIDSKEVLLVKQVRIPVLVNNPDTDGACIEACAGLVDKNIPINEIAREEVLEELGYDVPVENLQSVANYKSSVGSQGTNCYTFYAEVTEDMKVSEGGGLESEDIEIIRVPYNELINIKNNSFIDSTTLFLIMNFLYEHK